MFDCGCKFRKKEYAIIAVAIGIGILLALIMPPFGWMIGCAAALICGGVYYLKHF